MATTGTGQPCSPPSAEPGRVAPPRRRRSFFAELPALVLIAFLLALLLKTFLVQAFYIPSASMEPTLAADDRVLVNKVTYRLREPRRGEIVVFGDADAGSTPREESLPQRALRVLGSGFGLPGAGERDFIKRIVGLPGETVEMRDGVVYVDSEPLPEGTVGDGGYLAERDPTRFGPVMVPRGQYFMMGDNRRNSSDSRFELGTIPRGAIVGRAFVIIWPFGRAAVLPGASYEGDLGLPVGPVGVSQAGSSLVP